MQSLMMFRFFQAKLRRLSESPSPRSFKEDCNWAISLNTVRGGKANLGVATNPNMIFFRASVLSSDARHLWVVGSNNMSYKRWNDVPNTVLFMTTFQLVSWCLQQRTTTKREIDKQTTWKHNASKFKHHTEELSTSIHMGMCNYLNPGNM